MAENAVEPGTWGHIYITQAELAAEKAAEAAFAEVSEITNDVEKQNKLLLLAVRRLLILRTGEKNAVSDSNIDDVLSSRKITSDAVRTIKTSLADACKDLKLFDLAIGLVIELIVKETNINEKVVIANLVKPPQ